MSKAAKNSIQDKGTTERLQQAAIKVSKAMAKPKASPYVTHQEMQDLMHQLIQGQRELQHQMTTVMQTQAASSTMNPNLLAVQQQMAAQQMPMAPPWQAPMVDLERNEEDEEMLTNPNEWEAVDPSL